MNTGQVRWWEEKVERDGYSAERLPGKRDTDRQCEGEHAEKRMRRARNSKSKYTERIRVPLERVVGEESKTFVVGVVRV